MDPILLEFGEIPTDDAVEGKSHSFKMVPWICWDEWRFVKESLFSSDPDLVHASLQRTMTWRIRGCMPVVIEVTAALIEIRQKDSFFRKDLNGIPSQSDEALTMLYCMAIMRLVNGVVEKTRNKNEISIGEAADAIGLPRMLIDIRHECSHRDLPSLQLVRLASEKALNWLISYYWDPQEKAIPIQDGQTDLEKEIKSKLQKVVLCMRDKLIAKTSSFVKEKRSKKKLTKTLRNVLRLYYSFSREVVHILLDLVLSAMDSSDIAEEFDDAEIHHSTENVVNAYDEWKYVVLKLSRTEPEFLLTLTQAVFEKMEAQVTVYCKSGEHRPPEIVVKSHLIDSLSCLFEWLIRNLKKLYPISHEELSGSKGLFPKKHHPKEILTGLLRRCLLVSFPGNSHLMASALVLAHLIGDTTSLLQLKKLSLHRLSFPEPNCVQPCMETLISLQDSMLHAEEQRHQINEKCAKPKATVSKSKRRWSVAKSWNSCPIGMLPHTTGFSGQLPVLDCSDKCIEPLNLSDKESSELVSGQLPVLDCSHKCMGAANLSDKERAELNQNGKRVAGNDVQELDDTNVKKGKEGEDDTSHVGSENFMGHLMIDGVWRNVEEKEFLAIMSSVRLFV